jgi:hypothetical protein
MINFFWLEQHLFIFVNNCIPAFRCKSGCVKAFARCGLSASIRQGRLRKNCFVKYFSEQNAKMISGNSIGIKT